MVEIHFLFVGGVRREIACLVYLEHSGKWGWGKGGRSTKEVIYDHWHH